MKILTPHHYSAFDQRLYLALSSLSFAGILLLNVTGKLASCALLFAISILVINVITELFGTEKALKTITVVVLANAALVASFSNVTTAYGCSFCAALLSHYLSIRIFTKSRLMFGFGLSNLISGWLSLVTDTGLITVTLPKKLMVSQALEIGLQDVILKFGYFSAISILLWAAIHFTRSKILPAAKSGQNLLALKAQTTN